MSGSNDDVTDDCGVNECEGEGHVSIENDGSTQVRASTRFCRHMGPDEKSEACGICKLISDNFKNVSATERQQYGACEVDYLESMSDNGLVSISVPVEHHKIVLEFVDSMVALDYVRRNHADILLSYKEDSK